MKMKISAGSGRLGMLCLYDESGHSFALLSERRPDAERIALAIVEIVNNAGGIEIEPLPQSE